MSGSQEEKKAVPLSLTQQDVDGLTRGGRAAEAVRRGLRFPASKKTGSKPRSAKACPLPISRKEMAGIVKLRIPSSVRERIASASPSRIGVEPSSSTEKAAPTATPQKRKYAQK